MEEALQELNALCAIEVSIAGKGAYHRIPEPRELSRQLLEAANVKLPTFLPSKGAKVATKEKLTSSRKAAFAQCALTMHPDKTKVIYCKDASRRGTYPNTQFDFLGYTFRARTVKNSKRNSLFVSFAPAVSSKAVTAMRQKTRKLNIEIERT